MYVLNDRSFVFIYWFACDKHQGTFTHFNSYTGMNSKQIDPLKLERLQKRRDKYRFVLRRPQRSWKKWSTIEVERLIQEKLNSRCTKREDQCRQAIAIFGASARDGIHWKEFRDAVIGRLLVPVSVNQTRALWKRYDKENKGRISFHTLMSKLMPEDYRLPSSRSVLDRSGTIFGHANVDRSRRVMNYKIKHKWGVRKIYNRMRETLILRGGGFPVALKYYSMQTGRNNNSGLTVSQETLRPIIQRKFRLPATDAECDALFRLFDLEIHKGDCKGTLKFADMFKCIDLGRLFSNKEEEKKVKSNFSNAQSSSTFLNQAKSKTKRDNASADDLASLLSTSSWGTASSLRSCLSKSTQYTERSIKSIPLQAREDGTKDRAESEVAPQPQSARSVVRSNVSTSSRSKKKRRPKSACSSSIRRRNMGTIKMSQPGEIIASRSTSNASVASSKHSVSHRANRIPKDRPEQNLSRPGSARNDCDAESDLGDSASVAMMKLNRPKSAGRLRRRGSYLDSDIGDSASVVMMKLRKSRSQKYVQRRSGRQGGDSDIPRESDLVESGKMGKFGVATIAAAISAANHYRRIRTLAHSEGRVIKQAYL